MVLALGACGDSPQDTQDTSPDADVVEEIIPDDALAGDADAEGSDPVQEKIRQVPVTKTWKLKGLKGRVHVVRTAGSTPHIYAENEEDLARALGFVQAQDRYFFMELQRRLGLGTVSELLGEAGLDADIESRQMGLAYVTDRMVEHISPEFTTYLEAFADGVNQYIEAVRRNEAEPPTEASFAPLLGYQNAADMMAPFGVRDVVALATVFMYSTNFENDDPNRQAASERVAGQFEGVVDQALREEGFWGDVWADIRPIFPGTNSTDGFSEGEDKRAAGTAAARGQARGQEKSVPLEMLERLYEKLDARAKRYGRDRDAGFGSNIWAASSKLTKDGSSLFANDGHLELAIPPLGYGAGLDTRLFGEGRIHQFGGWLGNFPIMVGGTNGDVAWGGVNPVIDITDWYREEIKLDEDGKPAFSFFQGEWKPLKRVDESFTVAHVSLMGSEGRVETWARYETFDGRWLTAIEGETVESLEDAGDDADKVVNMMGDLVIPGDSDGDGVITAISFDHVAFDATRWPEALFSVGFAKDVEEVREATKGYVGSALFTGASDKYGSVLYTSYQAIPCRDYLPRDADGVFVEGADPTRLIDGTLYGGFTIPTLESGEVDEAPGADDPQRCVIPFEEMPYVINPESGYIFNANNDPAGLTDDGEERNDAYYIGGPWASVRGNTIRRDLEELSADHPLTMADMEAMQANVQSRLGESFVPYLKQAIAAAEAGEDSVLSDLYAADKARIDEAVARMDAWAQRGYVAASGVETFYHQPTADDRADAVATMIFNAYVRAFLPSVWGDEPIRGKRWGGEADVARVLRFLDGRGPDNPGNLASWNEATGESVFFDDIRTPEVETSDQLQIRSLTQALDFLEGEPSEGEPNVGGFGVADMDAWLWGLRHQARFESMLGGYIGNNAMLEVLLAPFNITTDRLPLAEGLSSDDPRAPLKWFPRPGDQWAVDAANPGLSGGFTHGSGPAMRMVFQLSEDEVKGRFILPGGQSGITESPYFDDQLRLWLANDYHTIQFYPEDVADHALGQEIFEPAPEEED